MSALASLKPVERQFYGLLRPPQRLSLATWADENFFLPAGDANAGPWTTLPYQRGIMDAMSDPEIERVSVMKSARVGYTKMFCAAVGYYIEHDPCPIMIVQPTLDDAKRHSKEDLAPMLREVPVLRGLVSDPKAKDSDNTILEKIFDGGSLSMIGANSPRGFRRTSRRVVIFDELDGYPESAGTEGDPVSLGVRRTEYYWNRKILFGSTPTFTGRSRIERAFLDGDQRRYWVPCPKCGAYQVLKWENLHPTESGDAVFTCVEKGCTIEHAHKRDMVIAGEWRADAPERFTPAHRHASFHIWSAYSYSPNATWPKLWAEWEEANAGGPLTRQTFRNTVQGETWQDRGEAPAWELLMTRREDYAVGSVPEGVCFLTCGCDVQKDRLVYEVVGWGRGRTSWSIEWGELLGETADLQSGPWAQLDTLLKRQFLSPSGAGFSIVRLAVDSGYNAAQVFAWSRRHPSSLVMVIKGISLGGVLLQPPTSYELTQRGTVIKGGRRAWMVSGHIAKNELYGFLRLEPPDEGQAYPPGYCHFPEYGQEWFKQLTAEEVKPDRTARGLRMVWKIIEGRRNDALDCRVYARAAAASVGLDRMSDADWDAQLGAIAPARTRQPLRKTETPDRANRLLPRREGKGGWFGDRPRGGWIR